MAGSETTRLRRRSRPWIWFGAPLALALLCVLGWTAFWFVGTQQTAASLDAWVAREKIFHRNWSCPERSFAGYPFGIEIACNKPGFDGLILGRHYSGSLAGFTASAELRDPNKIAIKVAPPFAVVSDDKAIDLSLAWEALDVRLGGLPSDVTEIFLAGKGLNLQGHAQGLGAIAARAQQGIATLTRDPARQDGGIHFDIALSGASFPTVDQFLADVAPAEIAAVGDITQASFDPAKTLVQTLDQWRARNGEVQFTKLNIMRGELKLEANGALALSATHQLQGGLDTKCVGYEPVLRRLGVDPGLITAGSLLVSLLGGGKPAQASDPSLHINVGFDSGRLIVGPVRTSIKLAPLY